MACQEVCEQIKVGMMLVSEPDPRVRGSGSETRMMHESKGQHIGKAPCLHLFHTTVRQCMGVFLKRTTSCLGMRLKPPRVFLQHCHKSVLIVELLLIHASGTT